MSLSAAPSPESKSNSLLFCLPRELRDQIYLNILLGVFAPPAYSSQGAESRQNVVLYERDVPIQTLRWMSEGAIRSCQGLFSCNRIIRNEVLGLARQSAYSHRLSIFKMEILMAEYFEPTWIQCPNLAINMRELHVNFQITDKSMERFPDLRFAIQSVFAIINQELSKALEGPSPTYGKEPSGLNVCIIEITNEFGAYFIHGLDKIGELASNMVTFANYGALSSLAKKLVVVDGTWCHEVEINPSLKDWELWKEHGFYGPTVR